MFYFTARNRNLQAEVTRLKDHEHQFIMDNDRLQQNAIALEKVNILDSNLPVGSKEKRFLSSLKTFQKQ